MCVWGGGGTEASRADGIYPGKDTRKVASFASLDPPPPPTLLFLISPIASQVAYGLGRRRLAPERAITPREVASFDFPNEFLRIP